MGANKFAIPDEATMAENIRRTYQEATEFDMRSGLEWYPRTRAYCQKLADMFGLPLRNVVGAYAVISPSLTKEMNDEQIMKIIIAWKGGLKLEWVRVGVYGMRNKLKAARCLDGDLTAVSGDKVSRFYRNIMGIGDDEVTVDRWALRVALADPKIQDTQGLTSAQYKLVHDAYVNVSDELGLKPLQTQAVTWECFRNRYFRKSADLAYK